MIPQIKNIGHPAKYIDIGIIKIAATYKLRWLLLMIPSIEQIIDAIMNGQKKIEIIHSHALSRIP